ncbi:MAG TPA: dTDP-4-dehydrorhamnose 3,5-epimerase [Alphaproteobacteria bacterium]|nr:dTDP-4-dehydrorhamnose 3,5-epimerase [Alphaproteobacteria bacterium]
MRIYNTDIEGLKIIELKLFADERGFFTERFVEQKFADHDIKNNFVQDNHSRSLPNVVRGLHYQRNPDQAKLVSCISGKILDVAVDIRKNSKTFGKHFSIELSGENGLMLFVPAGFAHGFSVLGNKPADVMYKIDGYYAPKGEGGIIYNDPELDINWKVENPVISNKDLVLPKFSEYKKNPLF